MKAKRILAFALCVLMLLTVFTGCGGNLEEQLVGAWYSEGGSPEFMLYDDGTCEIAHSYGSGTWAVVNGDQLKVTDYYGDVDFLATIIKIEDGYMTVKKNGKEMTLVSGEVMTARVNELLDAMKNAQ